MWDISKGNILLNELNKLDEAEAIFKELVAKYPEQMYGYEGLAKIANKQQKWELAIEKWDEVLKISPAHIWGLNAKGNILLNLDKLAEAETVFNELVAKYPDKLNGYDGLARVANKQQNWDLAWERWSTLVEKFPDNINGIFNQGNTLLNLDKIEEAETVFNELIAKYPDKLNGYDGLARVANKQQNWDLALTRWDDVSKIAPDNIGFLSNKANALLQLENFEEAETIYQQLKEQFPDKSQGLEGLTKVARLSGKLELGLQYAEQLKQQFPDSQSGYWETEQILIEMGRFDEATEAFLARPANKKTLVKRQKPANFPEDLILPPLVGVNNDYTFIEEKVKEFVASGRSYHLPVSIIIPVYNRKEILAKTLAAITHQSYPKNLIEVVVVDDGSSDGIEEVIHKYENYLELIYTRQSDRCYRLSAARNLGIRAAKHEHIIILDCDVLPPPNLVEDYLKYLHVSDQCILIGLTRYVCTDHLTDDDLLQDINLALNLPDIVPENDVTTKRTATGKVYNWRLGLYARTNYLKQMNFVQGVAGGNVAYPKQILEKTGVYDENFQHWGAEDDEIAYRFYNAGYYFIPVISATGLHQEPSGGKNETDREEGRKITLKQLEEKCSFPNIRKYQKGRIYEVPKVSIFMPTYNVEKYIKDAVDSVLNQTYTDLEICICNDGSMDKTLQVLEENYSNNPRVRWVSQANGGASKASNTALKMCRGMYVGQLDPDDLLKPNAVELSVNYLDNNPDVGFVYSADEVIDKEGKFIRESPSGYIEFSREALLTGMIVSPFRMFRKRDYMRTNGFDENTILNDYDICLKLSNVCYFHHLEKLTYSYRWHGENASIKNRKKQEIEHFYVINKALERLGLGNEWVAIQANITQPRSVKLCRKSTLTESNTKSEIQVNEVEKKLLIKQQLAEELLENGKIQEAINEYIQALNLPGEEKTTVFQGLVNAYRKIELEKAVTYCNSEQ